jgi:hypothetical protein
LLYAYEQIKDLVKNNDIRTVEDLMKVGEMVYDATAGSGMYGDTDLSDGVQSTLQELLEIPG